MGVAGNLATSIHSPGRIGIARVLSLSASHLSIGQTPVAIVETAHLLGLTVLAGFGDSGLFIYWS